MKAGMWKALAACCALMVLSGCVSTRTRGVEVGENLRPGAGERVIVDEVLVVVDVSGSMYGPDKFRLAKELTRSFFSTAPEGTYRAGLLSFGGEWTNEWVRHGATTFDREGLLSKTAQLQWLRGSTPLPDALAELHPGTIARPGHTAVVILSDGGADRQRTLDIADQMKNSHEGPLCFYTVHLGHNDGCCKAEKKSCCASKEGEAEAKACCSSKDGGEAKACCKGGECCHVMEGTPSADLDKNGHALLGALSTLSDCGKLWEAEDVIARAGMEDLVRTVFFGPGDGDEDGDGVPDSLDQCPGTPKGAKVDARGCWVLAGLNFDTDKSVIKPQFEGLLDEVAAVLTQNAGVDIRIDGHTDSRASNAYNQGLSERRANAVREALIKRGVDAGRLSAQGFGESKPIASNGNEAGRYQNRRVELTPVH